MTISRYGTQSFLTCAVDVYHVKIRDPTGRKPDGDSTHSNKESMRSATRVWASERVWIAARHNGKVHSL